MDYTFDDLIVDREEEFPVLARAVANMAPATNPKIEWLVGENDKGTLICWSNYCQIVRVPYQSEDHEKFKTEFLAAIEKILIYGIPSIQTEPFTLRTCGGFLHYLGRELEDGDVIRLRPLRNVRYYLNEGLNGDITEWLAEFSLQVVPAVPVAA